MIQDRLRRRLGGDQNFGLTFLWYPLSGLKGKTESRDPPGEGAGFKIFAKVTLSTYLCFACSDTQERTHLEVPNRFEIPTVELCTAVEPGPCSHWDRGINKQCSTVPAAPKREKAGIKDQASHSAPSTELSNIATRPRSSLPKCFKCPSRCQMTDSPRLPLSH